MKKNIYSILARVPIVGPIIEKKTNFFAFKCSPFMEEYTKTDDFKILRNWGKSHPDEIISPKMAEKIIAEAKQKLK